MPVPTTVASETSLAPPTLSVDRLIEEYHGRIYAFLRRLAGNDADAEDLTQRTFVRVVGALATFAGRSSIASWIYGIAHHVYLDWRRAEHPGEARTDEWWAACPATEPTPAEIVESADLAHALYTAVDRLSPDLRSTVHLHYYQELSLQETADALGTATSTVKYRLRQARDQLHAALLRQPQFSACLTTVFAHENP